jgi:hypothetical protein
VLKGEGEFERIVKYIVSNKPEAFSTATAKKPGVQVYISNDEYELTVPGTGLTLFIWKGSQVIIDET